MNVENILTLADTIEQHRIQDLGFNMSAFAMRPHQRVKAYADRSGHSCGTVACIGGHAVALAHTDWTLDQLVDADEGRMGTLTLHDDAREWLGLTEDQADKLFYHNPRDVPFHDVTPAMAVKTLRHLAATGIVDWNV